LSLDAGGNMVRQAPLRLPSVRGDLSDGSRRGE
jgi:hypothetical protein